MDHIVLNVTDMKAMLSFYTEILELPSERLEAFRAGQVPFPSVRLGENTVIDFFPEKMWAGAGEAGPLGSRLNHFCLALDNPEWVELIRRLLGS
jgi:catechol 2,3-dioxygenase-like lactoylglutathione lyase family enzyme